MLRFFMAGSVLLTLVFGFAGELWAQSGSSWAVDTSPYETVGPNALQRGPGIYLDGVKLGLAALVFLCWVGVADWVNRDAQENKEDSRYWNQLIFFSVFASLLVMWLLPWFWVSFLVLLLAACIPTTLYIQQRNAKLHSSDQVMTPDHIRFWLSEKLKLFGIKIAAEAKGSQEPPVELVSKGGKTDRDNSANLLLARQMPGYLPCAELLDSAIKNRATALMLDLTGDVAMLRYKVDTIWREVPLGPPTKDPDKDRIRDRRRIADILGVLKTVTALNPEEHTERQRGMFDVIKNKQKYVCRFSCQGIDGGERARIRFDDGAPHKARLTTIGIREESQKVIQDALAQPGKMVLVSAPQGGGLSSLLTAVVGSVDRYLRSVIALEDAAVRDVEVENVQVMTYDASANETPEAAMVKVARQYPDVIVVPDLASGKLATELCSQATDEKRLIITSLRALGTVDSLLRVLGLKVSRKDFVPTVTLAIHGRVLRKLCKTCKEPYTPEERILKQLNDRLLAPLNITKEQVEFFYRPPQPSSDPKQKAAEPCPDCHGTGYLGLTGIYEVLAINDAIREAIMSDPKLDTIRQAARQSGMLTLQEEGMLVVIKGETSVQELMRVLQGDTE